MATVQSTSPAHSSAQDLSWKRQTALTALVLLALAMFASQVRVSFFPLYQVQSQDVGPLLVISISLLAVTLWVPPWRFPDRLPKALPLLTIGAIIVGLLAYGSRALMGNFPLSIDERMVGLDMAVFDGGHLATPLAPEWRPYAKALFEAPLLVPTMPAAVVSSYLPVNALMRLAFSKLADPALFNPVLALAGGAALLDITRRTFGPRDSANWVVLLVYALSAQMLVNAMTAYSMTAHMALNIIWLAAYLRGGRLGHSAAILTGFVATGLHQLSFHPFFVVPFLLWRLRHGQWKLVLLYAGAYAAIILWWSCYPVLISPEALGPAHTQLSNATLASRVATAFAERRGDTFVTTVCNLLGFVAWQHVALLPLLTAAGTVALRDRGLAVVLFIGILSWLVFVTIVIPFQGHGWGYRYLHAYLGSFALLAGYGYREMRSVMGKRADGIVLGLSGVTAVATIPLLLAATRSMLTPYLALERLVASQGTPMVLIDTYALPTTDGRWSGNAIETVRNPPGLGARPLRFSSRSMTPGLLAGLCSKGRIAVISHADQKRIGFAMNTVAGSPSFSRLVDPVRREFRGCLVPAAAIPARGQQ